MLINDSAYPFTFPIKIQLNDVVHSSQKNIMFFVSPFDVRVSAKQEEKEVGSVRDVTHDNM